MYVRIGRTRRANSNLHEGDREARLDVETKASSAKGGTAGTTDAEKTRGARGTEEIRARRPSGRVVRTRATQTAASNPPREAKRDPRGDERKTKEETREVATRGRAEVLVRFVQFSDEERPCGAGTMDLIEDGRTGTEHRGSVAGLGCDVEGASDRSASEFVPSSPIEGPTVVVLDGAPIGRRMALRREESVRRIALLALAGGLFAGCTPDRPLGTVGAIVTAPITAPVMFVSARMNDREDQFERARRNDRPIPPIDATSRAMARATLEKALELGRKDEGLYWQNDEDASGHAAGGSTVIATGRTDHGRVCREVLIETAMERRPTDQRARTYCRDGTRWGIVESTRE